MPHLRPRTKAAKKRRLRMQEERRMKKYASKVMPMLSRPKRAKAVAKAPLVKNPAREAAAAAKAAAPAPAAARKKK